MSMSNLLFTQHIFLETSNLSEQDWLHHVFRRKCETTLACNFFLNAALAMNTDTWSVACRLFNLFKESILFPTSYFIVSKRWLIKDWMTPFFFARKFRQRAGQRGPRSCYFRTREKKLLSLVSDLPFHYITHVWRVTSRYLDRNVFKMAVNWAQKKNCRKFGFAQTIFYLFI